MTSNTENQEFLSKEELTALIIAAGIILGTYGWVFNSYTDYMMGFGTATGAVLVSAVHYYK